ncbi:hypothetical protein OEA41_003416 [Lepraria neglecta]|uniref:Cytochrome P450 n=1 Tax=Lepraria neglecta TaxID=209136 RepID=A0AAD9Z6Y2_9LECA|nr:hypothetical protein OEA41_003416 [Lepraria neglecta]
MRNLIDLVPNNGISRYLGIFNRERLVVTNPKALAEILVHKSYEFIKPPHFVSGIGRILGVGLLLAEGEEHKSLIDALIANNWHAPDKPEKSVDVCEWMSRATLNIIGVAGMGQEFNAIQHPDSELYQTYQKLFKPSQIARVMGPNGSHHSWLGYAQYSVSLAPAEKPAIVLSNLKNSIQRNSVTSYAAKVIKRICRSAIQRAKANPPAPNAKGSSLLSIALASGGFTDDDLVNQLMTFLIAGHETTASALSWCIVMLCKHPEMQAKLHDELRSGLPNPRTTFHSVNANEFDPLPYLNAICNETLRLFPLAPLTIRVAAKITTLLDHVIPKGTPIFPSCAVNVSRDLWGHDAM